jgi:hypothetical protein
MSWAHGRAPSLLVTRTTLIVLPPTLGRSEEVLVTVGARVEAAVA